MVHSQENSPMGYSLGLNVFPEHGVALYSTGHSWRKLGLLEANNTWIAPSDDGLKVLVVGPEASTVLL